jgi:molybdopterin/thiamine biosynthesis adenylyltransferase/rhodanese-related sulfurtransferase
MTLSNEEIKRYSRHLIMPEVGMLGQQKLKNASVLCVGTGGLGSPLALYLAAAGIGRIGLVDSDVVSFSNLQRQVLHHTSDVGRPKIVSASEKLRDLNPEIEIITHDTMLSADNALEICAQYDIIADGTDNFPTRYLTNDACVLLGKPNVYASIFRFEGQASVFYAKEGPCYRCLYPEPPPPGEIPSCAEGGVLGILPGILGLIQATEVIKLILGIGTPLIGRLMMFDALDMKTHELQLSKDPNCPICSTSATIDRLVDYEAFCGFDVTSPVHDEIAAKDVEQLLKETGRRITLLDVRDPHEWEICRIEGAKLIPLDSLTERLHELDTADEIIVYCLMGGRSRKAINLLHEAGFRKLRNLSGGIRAWADTVDKTMAIY